MKKTLIIGVCLLSIHGMQAMFVPLLTYNKQKQQEKKHAYKALEMAVDEEAIFDRSRLAADALHGVISQQPARISMQENDTFDNTITGHCNCDLSGCLEKEDTYVASMGVCCCIAGTGACMICCTPMVAGSAFSSTCLAGSVMTGVGWVGAFASFAKGLSVEGEQFYREHPIRLPLEITPRP